MGKGPESVFQEKIIQMLRKKHFIVIVLKNNGHKGVPDIIILSKTGRFLLMEFKRPDGKGVVSEEQKFWLNHFSECGPARLPGAVLASSEDEVWSHVKMVFPEHF